MKPPGAGVFRSLRGVNYRVWIAGAFVSNVGTWVQRTAQDWLVLTQLTRHDASALGLVMALQFGPQFLLLPWTGFAADHFNQRKLRQPQAPARASRNAASRALRVSLAAASNSDRASASRPQRNRKSPRAAGNGA